MIVPLYTAQLQHAVSLMYQRENAVLSAQQKDTYLRNVQEYFVLNRHVTTRLYHMENVVPCVKQENPARTMEETTKMVKVSKMTVTRVFVTTE